MNNLSLVRQEHGYKHAKDLAEAIGVPVSTYARYERGDGTNIPTVNLLRIAETLDVSVDELFARPKRTEDEELAHRIHLLSPVKKAMMLSYLDYLSKTDNI